MRLKYLVAIGAALVFVMLMANGVNGESDYPDDQRIIIAIDNSVSMNMSDPGCTRIERAKCFLSNKFNNNTSGTNWFALLIPRENSDTLVGGSEPYRYGVVNNSTLLTKNFSDIIRNLSEQESYICYNPTTSITNFALFLSDGVIMTFDKGKGPEKHFVFFSNGNITDNISAVTRAKNNGIKIDTIGFGDNQDNLKNLELISKETNGTYYYWNIDINITPKFVSVPPGSPVSFTINVTNKGNSNLRSVVVIDTLPSGLEYAENVEMDGRWCLGLMKPNDSETLLLEARINDSAPGILVNSIKAEGTVELDGTWLCDNVTDVDTATVRVIRQGIEVNKTANQSSGAPSTQISFTINVTNTGEVDFVDVEVKDTLPEGLDYVSDNRSGNNVSQNVTWNLGPLNASNSTCIELVAHIDGLKFGNLTNNITVTGVPPTGYNVTNSSSAVVTAVNASIEVNKMADPKKGSPSTNVTFTINVTNTGEVDFVDVEVKDTLPEGLDYVSDNRSGNNVSQNVTWNLGPLNASNSTYIELVAHIDGSKFGNLTNNVNVTGIPPTGYNVTSSSSVVVNAVNASIEVNKTANLSSGAPSTQISFAINVTNTGEVDFADVEVKDTLPEGLSYVSDNRSGLNESQNVTWNLGPLNASNSTYIELVAHIDGSKFGNLTNDVTVTGVPPTGYSVTNSGSAVVTAKNASIEINKTAYPKEGSPSTNVTFTINVTNTGEVDFVEVEVKDTLPEGLSYVSDNRSGLNESQNVTWNLGPLNASNSTYIELVAHIDGSKFGNLTNDVNVTGVPPTGYNVTNSSSAVVTAVNASIEVNKMADPKKGSPSTNVTFTINVTNTGEVDFVDVEVKDTLPEGLDYVSDNRSGNNVSQNVTWNLGPLNASNSTYIELVAHIDGSKFGNLTNFVEVEGKPEHGNNVLASGSVTINLSNNGTYLVFALDTSGSMKKYYRMAKNEGAEIVTGLSHFDNANVSIVSWDHESEIIFGPAPLEGSEDRLAEILGNLSGMCIETDLTEYDQGLNGSLAVLRDHAAESAASEKIIVFLTGFSEFEPGERLGDYISEANESGYRIFTIGIGINSSFNATQKQYSNLTKISNGAGGEFYYVTAFSSEELKPVMADITRVAEGNLRSADSGT